MNIISLNTWCGRTGNDLHDFFKKYKDKNIDIFCLQEVDLDGTKFGPDVTGGEPAGDPHLFSSIQDILNQHYGYFSPTLDHWWGNALFISEKMYRNVIAYGEVLISDDQQHYAPYESWFRRTMQWIDLDIDSENITVINLHGLWEKGKGKDDSSFRITQSKNILNFLETKKDRKIIFMGDFNLNPDTQSMNMLESFPLRNLIKEYDINDTRTSLYNKEVRYADYALVSPEITVSSFEVLPDVVSDHAPLYLKISL